MKKIFTFCVAALAAMTMNAAVTEMTVAEAYTAAMAMADGAKSTDTVAVTGYITSTNGTLNSSGQQTFWLDDVVNGATDKFEGYLCEATEGEAYQKGDKVRVVGILQHYVNNSGTQNFPEIYKGKTYLVEKSTLTVDTVEVDVCEAIEEGNALNAGEYTDDFFAVTGVVGTTPSANSYGAITFYMYCGEETTPSLQAYQCTGDEVSLGDTVLLTGKLYNYNGSQIEISGGTIALLAAGGVKVDTIAVSVAEAVALGLALETSYSADYYAVTGYVDSITYALSNGSMSFYMCDDMANPTKEFLAYKAKTDVEVTLGSKVTITGLLQNYNGLIEVSNGNLTIIELAPADALENIFSDEAAEKFIIDGQLYIRKDGVVYTVLGAKK